MYSYDTQKAIVDIAIGQLYILKSASDLRNPHTRQSDKSTIKDKVLLVEGKSDVKFWKRIVSDTLFIDDVKSFADSICALLNKPTNNKRAVIGICEALSVIDQSRSDSQSTFEKWEINGVIDRDFDEQTFGAVSSLHVTDTHDLETLLLYTDSELLQRLIDAKSYGILITNEQADSAKRLSLQMGLIRMALRSLPRELKNWFYLPQRRKQNSYRNQERIDYALLNDHGNFDLMQFLRATNNLQTLQDRKDDQSLKEIERLIIMAPVLKRKIGSDGKWSDSKIYDDELTIWRIINGHDYLRFLRSLVPGAEKAYKSDYQADNALEFDLIQSYDTSRLIKTRLYCSMQQSNLFD